MKDTIFTFLELRILVLTLGETQYAGWWKSQFMSQVGFSFLERVYPRGTFAAAMRSAARAARIVHDANVGKGAVCHLFRLSPEVEREIDTALTERSSELRVRYQPLLMDQAALLAALEKLAGDAPAQSTLGPVRLPAKNGNWVSAMAAAYLTAFRDGTQVFPYLEEKVRLL